MNLPELYAGMMMLIKPWVFWFGVMCSVWINPSIGGMRCCLKIQRPDFNFQTE